MSDTNDDLAGAWQTVEQAAVSLGLSVRTVNRHISAQKLRSRLMEGRREVFVAFPESQPTPVADTSAESVSNVPPGDAQFAAAGDRVTVTPSVNPSFDLESALARADNAVASSNLSVSAYQSLTRIMEAQAQQARRMALAAWTAVAVMGAGVTVAVGWTATRLTRAETQAEQLRRESDTAAHKLESQETLVSQLQNKLSEEQMRAAGAEGQVKGILEQQARQSATRPASRPSLIDRLTNAFGE